MINYLFRIGYNNLIHSKIFVKNKLQIYKTHYQICMFQQTPYYQPNLALYIIPIVFAAFGALINHLPPVCWSIFWKSSINYSRFVSWT